MEWGEGFIPSVITIRMVGDLCVCVCVCACMSVCVMCVCSLVPISLGLQ